uniref:Beta/gamma crystallin 'Greek key' domain-containing protein n=1 Tax=Strigops habroptila TaxID=2489341 RepID=A0A672TUY5_STRHB
MQSFTGNEGNHLFNTSAISRSVSYRILLYEKEKLQGKSWSSLMIADQSQATSISLISALNILGGSWILYEMPNLRGQQYLLKDKTVSLQRLADLH